MTWVLVGGFSTSFDKLDQDSVLNSGKGSLCISPKERSLKKHDTTMFTKR